MRKRKFAIGQTCEILQTYNIYSKAISTFLCVGFGSFQSLQYCPGSRCYFFLQTSITYLFKGKRCNLAQVKRTDLCTSYPVVNHVIANRRFSTRDTDFPIEIETSISSAKSRFIRPNHRHDVPRRRLREGELGKPSGSSKSRIRRLLKAAHIGSGFRDGSFLAQEKRAL